MRWRLRWTPAKLRWCWSGGDDVDRHRDVLAVAADRGVGVLEVTARAVAKLADATTPPGIFAVCGLLDVALDEVLTSAPQLLAVAVEPREPGKPRHDNRCADAMVPTASWSSVTPSTHNGKCVRASAGSVFHLPIVRERSVDEGLAALRSAGAHHPGHDRRR